MEHLHGFPFFRLEFNKEGDPVDPQAASRMVEYLASPQGKEITDLAVLSHGWNNNMAEAQALYEEFFGNAQAQWQQAGLAGRRLAVACVFWPSKKFTDAELIPGGAASLEEETPSARLQAVLSQWADSESDPAWQAALRQCGAELPALGGDEALQDRWVARLLGLIAEEEDDELEAVALQRGTAGREVLQALSAPLILSAEPDDPSGDVVAVSLSAGPDADVTAAGLGSLWSGLTGGAAKFFNLFTYYAMKDRAGRVGARGLGPILRKAAPVIGRLRLHLAGHSFGARLVTAALRDGGFSCHSLSLLQAAFSHFAFSPSVPAIQGKPGHFRPAMQHLQGPMMVTHTANDLAVGVAYAMASRTANQIAASVAGAATRFVGGPNDPYGGLGRNGAQLTPEAAAGQLLPSGGAYAFQPGKVFNLQADQWVKGHGDIRNIHVTWAWLNAIRGV
jgi:hypothetical protein